MDQATLLERLGDASVPIEAISDELSAESPAERADTLALLDRLSKSRRDSPDDVFRRRVDDLRRRIASNVTRLKPLGAPPLPDPRTRLRAVEDGPTAEVSANITRRRIENTDEVEAGHDTRIRDVESTTARRPHPSGRNDETIRQSDNEAVDLQEGSVVHDWYRLESMLGVGAMGQVWKAMDLQRERTGNPQPHVALKLVGHGFSENPHAMIALAREADKAQRLAHPNIATVFTFAVDPKTEQPYLAMELLEGTPLDRLIREHRNGMPRERALAIIRGLASGLANAHSKGIVHCDFKPGNAFVTKSGVAKVLDFGIARLAQEVARAGDHFDAGVLRALTPPYASLEMLQDSEGTGKPHPADDVYALGVVAYELLNGRHPFAGRTAEEALAERLTPAPLKHVKRHECRAIEQALKLHRTERWPDAHAFLKALDGISPWVPALGGLAATLAIVVVYVGYQNHLESLPQVPFEQLSVEVQSNFRELMALGDRDYRFATEELQAGEALNAVYGGALTHYGAAYQLHAKNPDADAALRRSFDFLEERLGEADPDTRASALVALEAYRNEHAVLAKYAPLTDLIEELR